MRLKRRVASLFTSLLILFSPPPSEYGEDSERELDVILANIVTDVLGGHFVDSKRVRGCTY